MVSRAVSAAAFLAVSGVELTLPWPDEFTKQMAVQPPCFLHPTDVTTHSSSDVNASGGGGDNSLSSFHSRPNGTLLLHSHKRPEDVDVVGGGGHEKSPERPAPSEALHPPPSVATSFVSSSVSRVMADVPGSQLDAEYEAQLELYRRRQQGLANGVGPSIPGDCRPLSPIQDDASYYPSPGSSPPSDAGDMEVESSSCTAPTVGRASGVSPGKLSFPAAVASSSPVSSNSAAVSDSPVLTLSEARKHEAEASAAVGAAQARVKKEKRAAEKAKGEVRAASVRLAAAKERAAEAEKEVEASVNPGAVDIVIGGSKSSSIAKKKRRKKNGRVQDFTAVTAGLPAAAVAGGGGNGSVSGSDVSSESGMGGRSGTCSNGGATGGGLRGEGGGGSMLSPGVGCAGGGVELNVSGAGTVGEVSATGKGSGGIDAGMSDAVCAQLKTKPMKGWGVDVEAELGPWEVSV